MEKYFYTVLKNNLNLSISTEPVTGASASAVTGSVAMRILFLGQCTYSRIIEEEEARREGKSRRCCLGERNDSTPCRTTDVAPG